MSGEEKRVGEVEEDGEVVYVEEKVGVGGGERRGVKGLWRRRAETGWAS